MFMNSPWRKALGSTLIVGLVVTLASGQTRPGSPPPAADARARISAKVNDLSRRIAAQVEAARLNEKAAAALAMLEDVTGDTGETSPSKLEQAVPSLANDRHMLQQYENELADMAGRLGAENPKYQALATRLEAMRKAYQKNLVTARERYAKNLAEARREAAFAKRSLDEATAGVQAAQRELVDLAVTLGR
jgi:hypothetical protein